MGKRNTLPYFHVRLASSLPICFVKHVYVWRSTGSTSFICGLQVLRRDDYFWFSINHSTVKNSRCDSFQIKLSEINHSMTSLRNLRKVLIFPLCLEHFISNRWYFITTSNFQFKSRNLETNCWLEIILNSQDYGDCLVNFICWMDNMADQYIYFILQRFWIWWKKKS